MEKKKNKFINLVLYKLLSLDLDLYRYGVFYSFSVVMVSIWCASLFVPLSGPAAHVS